MFLCGSLTGECTLPTKATAMGTAMAAVALERVAAADQGHLPTENESSIVFVHLFQSSKPPSSMWMPDWRMHAADEGNGNGNGGGGSGTGGGGGSGPPPNGE